MQGPLHCKHGNKEKKRNSGKSVESLTSGISNSKGDPSALPGPIAVPPPDELKNKFKIANAKSRRFLMLLGVMILVPLGLLAAGWAGWLNPPEASLGRLNSNLATVGAVFYVCLVYGYLVGKTGESSGAPFASNFMLGCLPPLTPALFARFCGRPALRPYYCLLVDFAIVLAVGWFVRELPYLLLILVFVMLPLMLHHLCGCVTGQMAGILGLTPWVLGVWLCLIPDMLLILMMRDLLGAIDPLHSRQPFSLTLAEFQAYYLSPDDLFAFNGFKLSVFIYLLVTVAGWIKLVYENLRIPIA